MFVYLTLMLAGCSTPPDVADIQAPSLAVAEETSENPYGVSDALLRALSMRDAPPPCEKLRKYSGQLYTDLGIVVETVRAPAFAPMRAAACMQELYPEKGRQQYVAWMGDGARRGLAIQLANRIDQLPREVALEVGQAGIAGPHRDVVRPRLARSHRSAIVSLTR